MKPVQDYSLLFFLLLISIPRADPAAQARSRKFTPADTVHFDRDWERTETLTQA